MAALSRCPTELLAAIMGNCESLGDVKALMLACSRNHAVWLAHAPVIIAAVAPRTLLLFDEALLAARATEMVHKAELASQLPPAIDPRSLTVSFRLPTPSELTAVVDLNRFAECIQARYCEVFDDSRQLEEMYYAPMGRWPLDRRRGEDGDWSPEEPEGMLQWTERFRRAIYTTLLLGAGLARPYQEPFVSEEAHRREKFPNRWRFEPSSWEGEVAYLRQYPVFKFINENGGHEAVFGDTARWLVESTLERIRSEPPVVECPSRSLIESRAHWRGSDEGDVWAVVMMLPREDEDLFDEFPLGSRAECEGVIWVVMQTVQMFEFLLESIVDHPTEPSLGRGPGSAAKKISDEIPVSHGSSQRTVNVVLFGTFRAETITIPNEASEGALYAQLAAPPVVGRHEFANIPCALSNVYCGGSVPNILGEHEAPPPPLQFYTYLLRAHFNLQFIPSTFDMVEETRRQLYRHFKWSASIFANPFDDVPERTWLHKDIGIERRLIDVTMGAEILEKYKAAVSGARRMACDPRTFDDFESFASG